MIGLILGGLGSAATAAGMTGLGAGLTAAGTALGGSGIPGMGGVPGIGGVGPGSAPPGAMPFGFDITKLLPDAQSNLGTGDGQTPMQGLLQKDQQQTQALMQQTAQAAAPQAPAPRAPVDISQLLAAIQGRGQLGT